jgi:hypothetical protein
MRRERQQQLLAAFSEPPIPDVLTTGLRQRYVTRLPASPYQNVRKASVHPFEVLKLN